MLESPPVTTHTCYLSLLHLYSVHLPSVAYPYTSSSTFVAGSGPIFLSGLNCIGNEQTLLECSSYPHPYYYSHGSDAGVRCEHRQYSGDSKSQLICYSKFCPPPPSHTHTHTHIALTVTMVTFPSAQALFGACSHPHQ